MDGPPDAAAEIEALRVGGVLLIGFLLQAVFGTVAGVGVWRGARWASLAVVSLGASIAATALVEGFVLWIVGYFYALLEAVAAIAITLLIAAYVRRGHGS